MKVKLLISRAGVGFSQNRGDIVEVSAKEGKRMLEAEPPQAEPVRSTGGSSEKTVKRSRSGRKGK